MKWLWLNTTQVGFGVGCVKEHMSRFIKPNSRILCTFGGGSIDKNGARKDTEEALEALHCEVRWEGGIPANPEYERLMEIVKVVREWAPDCILAVGGGSVLDGTKFISCAAKLPEDSDAWQTILVEGRYPETFVPVGSVMTLPATGSEWNSNFVISWRAKTLKQSGGCPGTFPVFSLLDPQYTMTLPVRQLRNGVCDAIIHVIDQFLTGQELPMMDSFWMSTLKELVDIAPEVVQENSSLDLHERLVMAASFALNFAFTLGKEGCWGIHMIGHQLTAKYDIDHGTTLAIVCPHFLENQFDARVSLLAQSAEFVFGFREGTQEEKAHAFIKKLTEVFASIGQISKISEWPDTTIGPNDVDEVTKMVMESVGNAPFGFRGQVTEADVSEILKKCLV